MTRLKSRRWACDDHALQTELQAAKTERSQDRSCKWTGTARKSRISSMRSGLRTECIDAPDSV